MGDWDFEIKPREKKRKFIRFEDLIIFENDDVIVVNKPAGFTSVPERWDTNAPNIFNMGQRYYEGLLTCHRLDRMTTGVLLFAKNAEAHRLINIQFQDRETVKHYMALVEGRRQVSEFVIDAPISVSNSGKVKLDNLNGKEAVTVVDTAELFRNYTLLDCMPMTGRTHQIRIHLSGIGNPIVGDQEYGGKDLLLSSIKKNFKLNRTGEESPLNDGYLLHARGLSVSLPGEDSPRNFVAPLPAHFELCIRMLQKYDA